MKDSDLLATVPIFSDLSAKVLDELLSRMTKRSYQKNNMILMEDEFGDTFFIIASGSIKITRVSEDGREVILAMLGEGEFFGEMSLLDGETRSIDGDWSIEKGTTESIRYQLRVFTGELETGHIDEMWETFSKGETL